MLNIIKSVNFISNVLFQKIAILPTWRNFWFDSLPPPPPPSSHMPQCTGNCSFTSCFPLNILSFTTPLPHSNFQ